MKYFLTVAGLALAIASPAAGAEGVGGRYVVSGTNFNGTPYSGEAGIALTSETTCAIEWTVNGATSTGICMRNGDAFSAAYELEGKIGLIIYRLMDDGSMHGLWTIAGEEGNGTEVLTPAP
jgi:hypothetical protein